MARARLYDAEMRIAAVLLMLTLSATAAEVVPGVHVIRGNFTPGAQPDGNTIILDAPEGLIVIDSGRHVAHTRQILDFARTAGRPIRAVINTHWHLDHVGGNVLIRREYPDARVYASDAIRKALTGFLANYRKQLVEMKNPGYEAEIALIDAGAALAPDVVITRSGRMSIAGRELMIGLEGNAVTAGDVWVLDERTGVLMSGDLVTLPAPFLDTACPSRWAETLQRIADQKFDLLVPGHGEPMTRTQFSTYRAAFTSLLKCESKCGDAWIAAIRPLAPALDEKFTQAMMGYYVDLLRDPAKLAANCPH